MILNRRQFVRAAAGAAIGRGHRISLRSPLTWWSRAAA